MERARDKSSLHSMRQTKIHGKQLMPAGVTEIQPTTYILPKKVSRAAGCVLLPAFLFFVIVHEGSFRTAFSALSRGRFRDMAHKYTKDNILEYWMRYSSTSVKTAPREHPSRVAA